MADLPQFEDEATRYVLGEMDAAERCAFESQLKQSAELRVLVRELEEGVEAAALACPLHQPPSELWRRIERAVAEESRDAVVIAPESRTHWLPYAWAAAACVAGALLLGGVLMRGTFGRSPTKTEVVKSSKDLRNGASMTSTSALGKIVVRQTVREPEPGASNQAFVPRQKPVSDTASRPVQFFSGAASNSAPGMPALPPSTDVQRALFAAMARDLGWSSGRESDAEDGVDVVDLRPPEAALVPPPPRMVTATGSLVGFVSGDSLYLAFGSNTVPRGQELQFWVGTPDDGEQLLGTAMLGENPLVVVAPMSIGGPNGTLTIIGVSATGVSNVFGQIFIVAPSP
jgi:hypothetical protein